MTMSADRGDASEDKSGVKGERFLRKAEREACWGAKDRFWDCLRANGERAERCGEARRGFEDLCPPTWVQHFDRKFQYEKFKAKLESEGYQKLDEKFSGGKGRREEKEEK